VLIFAKAIKSSNSASCDSTIMPRAGRDVDSHQ